MRAKAIIAALLILTCSCAASAADSFNPANKHLTMPKLVIGAASYQNVVVSVGLLISGPSGTSANGSVDTYDPASNEVTVQAVTVGTATYYNVVAKVTGMVSIGSVTGADSYNAPNLRISFAELGGTVYDNVVITVGSVVAVDGGMPALGPDTYDPLNHNLHVTAAQVGDAVVTNAVITVGKVLAVGGISSTVDEKILQSFSGSGSTGARPEAGLLLGKDGNYYGTSFSGGSNNLGAVFRITPDGVPSTIYSFAGNAGNDGAAPSSTLIEDDAGNLYGTTRQGGTNGQGTVFEITAGGVESVLYSFGTNGASDGASPDAGLVRDSSANLLGTTQKGGTYGEGTVFKLAPNGTETVLWSFTGHGGISGSDDCAIPEASLILALDGNYYGTTVLGGAYNEGCIFRITPEGSETALYSFSGNGGISGSTDGALVYSSLIQASNGNLYGTTEYGGVHDEGTVFRITLGGSEAVVYSFTGGPQGVQGSTDGAQPVSNVIQANDGNLYGATFRGGTYDSGTLFKVSLVGVESVLYSFTGSVSGTGGLTGSQDGGGAVGLVQVGSNTFAGTTEYGGAAGDGAIFTLADPAL